MTGLEWFLSFTLFALYVACLFTVCVLTFKKGYTWLGIVGIFLPILWLIGAILPAKAGSRAQVEDSMRRQAQIERLTR